MSINTKKYIESYIKIRDKKGNVIPLKLNEPQLKYYNVVKKLYEEKKPIRIIILKARQMGFSTETESIIFKNVVTNHNYNAGIVAHKEDSTTNLFNMSKRMLEYLPESIKPEQKKSNAKELVFNNEEDLVKYCSGIQAASPIDSFSKPLPWDMPGYDDKVVMAAGTFIQGSSIELSCDGPIRPPFIAYQQGSLTYPYGKLAVMKAVDMLLKKAK